MEFGEFLAELRKGRGLLQKEVANYLNVTLAELKSFARITGHSDVHDLSVDDLVTINREISEYTNIRHA